jgi:hypothetical protein
MQSRNFRIVAVGQMGSCYYCLNVAELLSQLRQPYISHKVLPYPQPFGYKTNFEEGGTGVLVEFVRVDIILWQVVCNLCW